MLSLSLYHWTDEISSRKLRNRAFHLAIAENSPITEPGLSGGKNSVWGKPPLKMDLVEVEEKHIPKPGVHGGNNNSLNNNDHKLLNMAEWWQDFLKELAEHWCFKDRGVGCVLWFYQNKGRLFVLLTLCQHKQLRLRGGSKWKKITVLMPCYVFTPPLFWVAGVVLFATTLLFSSAMPTSVLTFKKKFGPGYWVPHQWRYSHVDCPCIAVWHASLVTSRLCWCQLAVSAGWPRRSSKFFLSSRLFLPTCTGAGFHRWACPYTHFHTNTSHTAKTKAVLLHIRDKSKCAPWSPHTCALNAQQM